jgi:hypothetical protein
MVGRFLAPNSDLLEQKRPTPSSLREDFASQNLPVLLHDPESAEVLKVLVEETYESKAVRGNRARVVPHCTVIVALNDDPLAEMRTLVG